MLLISELIKELKDVQEEFGDVNIMIINDDGQAVEIEDIGYHEDFHPVNRQNYVYFSS